MSKVQVLALNTNCWFIELINFLRRIMFSDIQREKNKLIMSKIDLFFRFHKDLQKLKKLVLKSIDLFSVDQE